MLGARENTIAQAAPREPLREKGPRGSSVTTVTDLADERPQRLAVDRSGRRSRTNRTNDRLLRILNIGVASAALLLLSPVMVLIAVVIKLESKGPILYRQLRIGLDRRILEPGSGPLDARRTADLGGLPFNMYKFRTMQVNAERNTGPIWACPGDERTTRVGGFLRRYRLDEIPQFINVLAGEMAVVGPRPERPSFVQDLRERFDQYGMRQRVAPGITGWAQVNQAPDQSMDDVGRKLDYDLEYLRRRSLTFDLRIMFKTLPTMLTGNHDEREQ